MDHRQYIFFSTRNIVCVITAIFSGLLICSCDSDPADAKIDFVGDSIVARWDINQDFPSYLVYNYGIGGSGIDLLISYDSRFSDDDVVVLSGTNDHSHFKDGAREEYAYRYINAILSLTDRRIYLFSVLPRDFAGDRSNINSDIMAFNRLIQDYVQDIERITYLDVYQDFIKDNKIDMTYFSDGLHPNTIGYEILTQKLLQAL